MKSCVETTYMPHRPQVKIYKFGLYVVFPSDGRSAHLRFYLLVFKSDPLDECEYTS